MSAEEFIQDYTRTCSNEMESPLYANPKLNFYPWLTPDEARKAVEIAREEMLNEICKWIGEQKELLEDSFSDPNDFADILKHFEPLEP